MLNPSAFVPKAFIKREVIYQTLTQLLYGNISGEKCLVLIPNHNRSLQNPILFKMMEIILDGADQLDFLVALSTHPPLNEDQSNRLVEIRSEERQSKNNHIQIFNHAWRGLGNLVSLYALQKDEVQGITGDVWHESMPLQAEILISKYVEHNDVLFILEPSFLHQVVGDSGGVKCLDSDITGLAMICATHRMGFVDTGSQPVWNDIIIILIIRLVLVNGKVLNLKKVGKK